MEIAATILLALLGGLCWMAFERPVSFARLRKWVRYPAWALLYATFCVWIGIHIGRSGLPVEEVNMAIAVAMGIPQILLFALFILHHLTKPD